MDTLSIAFPGPQRASFRDLREVEPLNEGDSACLKEVGEILKKHGKLDRFGISLLHKHFNLAPNEVLVEYNNPGARVLIIKPERQEETEHTTETMWVFRDAQDGLQISCPRYCTDTEAVMVTATDSK
jgi:hypothetical protein